MTSSSSSFALPRKLLILALILPIAALVGYLLADPTEVESLAILGVVVCALVLPWVLKWHHPMLVFSWNASLIVFFLPGSPYLWMLMAVISLGVTALNRFLDPNFRLINVPLITWTLLLLGLVVILTAQLTGGFGIRSLGGSVYGGKKYYYIWFAILAYFALSCRPIPAAKASLYSGAFFASGVTAAFSTLVYVAGPAAWVLYSIFPTDGAMHMVTQDFGGDMFAPGISRWSGFSFAGVAVFPLFFMRYGIRGLMDYTRPWRMTALLLVLGISMLSGFRSMLGLFGLLCIVQFWNEGLFRSRLFPVLLFAGFLGFVALIPLARHLPLSMQRSLSSLPIPVSQVARGDAEVSTKWRQDMWKMAEPEVGRYFWLGKGFTASSRAYFMESESVKLGLARDYEMMILVGDYHSGWRSVMIPFGIWGMLAFLTFLGAGLRVLWINRSKGDPKLQRINLFLLSYFIAKGVFFFAIFGALSSDLFTFTGIIALSVSLNGGAAVVKTD